MTATLLLTAENKSMLEGDFLLDLLVTALEGGSNYWYQFNFGLLSLAVKPRVFTPGI